MNILAEWKQKRKNLLLARQLRLSLQTLVHGLRTGAHFLQALHRVAQEGEDPLAREWKTVLYSVQMGNSFSQALSELGQRVPLKELAWFISAVQITQETGGSLSNVLESLAATLQERENLREKISALTAPGKASGALLSLLPFLMMAALSWVAPEFIQPFFQTSGGGLLLILIGILIMAGIFTISKIVSVPVD